ncbi:MAG: PfkB family carbohydrate kinase [Planctomycetaceae bacterium]
MSTAKSPTHPPVIVGLGEVLWDVFPTGPRFGGAPANFACASAGLSPAAKVSMVSGVGRDELGRQARRELQDRSVETTYLAESDRPTGTVHVELDDAGHADYRFADNTAWDCLTWSAVLNDLAAATDAVCFGTLGQRSDASRLTIQQFVKSVPNASLRILDINLRPPFFTGDVILESLALANVLKLNDEELPVVARLCGVSGTDAQIVRTLSETFGLRAVAVTAGAAGAMLLVDGELRELPGVTVSVVDTVGAGDAFTAATTLGLLAGRSADDILQHAVKVAAFVCTQRGATPAFPVELQV